MKHCQFKQQSLRGGRIFNISGKGVKPYMANLAFHWGDHVILSYSYKFMSDYLYFPNNLKDIKDILQTDMISCKVFFQLMVTVFKEKLNLQPPLIFYGSIRFVLETAFISEQIAESKFGVLLEISDKLITKFNVFSYMILQFRPKGIWKIYCMTLKTVARQFCMKGLYHKCQR